MVGNDFQIGVVNLLVWWKRFPNWLIENSLWNMVSLVLEECESCQRLPPLELLSFLKVLRIRKLDGIVCIDGDFHGNNVS